MGLCKCRNRTDLFCFVHKTAVCPQCLYESHRCCIVKSYLSWLQDSDYEPAKCVVCKETVGEPKDAPHPADKETNKNIVLLPCLDKVHPQCLQNYVASFPPHTAPAGFVCPACQGGLFPASLDPSPLTQGLHRFLCECPAVNSNIYSLYEKPSKPIPPPNISNRAPSPSPATSATTTPSAATAAGGITIERSGTEKGDFPLGIAPRKPLKSSSSAPLDAEDDKYKKRSLVNLLIALGFLKSTKKDGKRGATLVNPIRMFLLFLFLSFVVIIFIVRATSSPLPVEE